MCAKIFLKGACDEEGRTSASYLMNGSKVRDENDEEVTKQLEQHHLKSGA